MKWGGEFNDWNDVACNEDHPYICQEAAPAVDDDDATEPPVEPEVGAECEDDGDDGFYDCNLECFDSYYWDEGWIGDDYCDDGSGWWGGPDLSCAEFDFDGGDCEPPADAFLPDGDYAGEIESVLIYDYGWFESRADCEGELTGTVDTDATPQITITGTCGGGDGAFAVSIDGDFDDEVPSGTIVFSSSEDSVATDWTGEWRFGRLEAEFGATISSGFPEVRFEGEFEVDLTTD